MKKTVSIPQWMDEFLNENPELSPSKMLQSKITEIQEQKKISMIKVRQLQRKLNHAMEMLNKKCLENEDLENELAKKNENQRIPGTQEKLREFAN